MPVSFDEKSSLLILLVPFPLQICYNKVNSQLRKDVFFMLKGIPNLLTPELLKILMEMGHGDTIVIGDGNFPHASIARDSQLVRLDGHGACEVLDAILTLFPLDTYVPAPVSLMQVVPGDNVETPIWDRFASIIEKHQPGTKITQLERFSFYETARKAYAVVSTSETALYANVILQKGVVK